MDVIHTCFTPGKYTGQKYFGELSVILRQGLSAVRVLFEEAKKQAYSDHTDGGQ